MKKYRSWLVALSVITVLGLAIWNAPGVKSRRLGDSCTRHGGSQTDICYMNVARDYRNTQLCDRIGSDQMKSLCYTNVRYWDKSVDFCEGDEQRDICLHIVSVKQQDKGICSRINSEAISGLCLGNVE